MSLQWTLAAGFLYLEMIVVLFLILPILSAKRLNNILKSGFFKAISAQAQWYFGFIIVVLGLFLLDAIREVRKYSDASQHHGVDFVQAELQHNVKLFRSQRNLHISGFALFLSFVIRQLVRLISEKAVLMAEKEAALKQAQSATSTARNLMNQASSGGGEEAQNQNNEARQKIMDELNEEINKYKELLKKAEVDKEAVISQSKSLESEYDRLMEEHRKLQLKVATTSNDKDE